MESDSPSTRAEYCQSPARNKHSPIELRTGVFNTFWAEAVQCRINLGREDAVTVVNEISMARFSVQGFTELLSGPVGSRMIRNVAVQDTEWSRNSCRPPVIILEQTAEPLATLDG